MRDHLLLYINGVSCDVRGDDAFRTLSDFLRQRMQLSGTKVVCAEGDCGSCSVLVGRVRGQDIVYAPVTSCIVQLYQLDVAHVVTIEGLKQNGQLNPLQDAMVKCHGAQCGFCTPGFVITGHHLLTSGVDGGTMGDHAIRRGLVGNLCRCTGYDSIVRAMKQTDVTSLCHANELFPCQTLLPKLDSIRNVPVEIHSNGRSVFKPVTIEEAVEMRAAHPDAMLIAGASDVGVYINKHVMEPRSIIYIGDISGFDSIEVFDDTIRVAGGATLDHLERVCQTALPVLAEYLQWFASPLIKNIATLAGNLMTASPIGDMTPPLIALGGEVELISKIGSRRVAIEQFITGYRKTALRPDELVGAILIPRPPTDWTTRLYKVSKRKDMDISTVSAAIHLRLAEQTILEVRIVMGGVGATAIRLARTEAAIRGRPFVLETFAVAADIAREEVSPITDVRGSDVYRRTVVGNLLLKFFHEVSENIPSNGVH